MLMTAIVPPARPKQLSPANIQISNFAFKSEASGLPDITQRQTTYRLGICLGDGGIIMIRSVERFQIRNRLDESEFDVRRRWRCLTSPPPLTSSIARKEIKREWREREEYIKYNCTSVCVGRVCHQTPNGEASIENRNQNGIVNPLLSSRLLLEGLVRLGRQIT